MKDFLMDYKLIEYFIGTRDDPDDKSGLLAATVAALEISQATRKSGLELERKGVLSEFSLGRDRVYQIFKTISGNKYNLSDKLDYVSEKILKRAKEQVVLQIKAESNDPRADARNKFVNLVLGQNSPYGVIKDVKKITLDEVNSLIKKMNSNKAIYYTNTASNLKIKKIGKAFKYKKVAKTENKTVFIPAKVDQKIVLIGHKTGGKESFDPVKQVIATSVLSNSALGGIYMQEVREKRSLAYFAFVSHKCWLDEGLFYFCCGVNEANVNKVIEITDKVRRQILKGEFEIEEAKESAKTVFLEIKGNSESLFSFCVHNYPRIKNIDECIKSIQGISKEQIIQYYKEVFKLEGVNFVYGNVSKEIQKRA